MYIKIEHENITVTIDSPGAATITDCIMEAVIPALRACGFGEETIKNGIEEYLESTE